jgi:hypothetical protein
VTALRQLLSLVLRDDDAEKVRRNHHECIRELQARIRELEARVAVLEAAP